MPGRIRQGAAAVLRAKAGRNTKGPPGRNQLFSPTGRAPRWNCGGHVPPSFCPEKKSLSTLDCRVTACYIRGMTQERLKQMRELAAALNGMADLERGICVRLWVLAAVWCGWWALFLLV